ncbi:uncharacterized protein LOC126009581 [Suncus etruscus]|uniref:uncharacterized protein LOC126009581 n=1 Tax=Suncus etruscus TaxID=109475 RepID=UPI002110D716|nr:uncharacterized protein LOC126009581 [Suncus etruscus]
MGKTAGSARKLWAQPLPKDRGRISRDSSVAGSWVPRMPKGRTQREKGVGVLHGTPVAKGHGYVPASETTGAGPSEKRSRSYQLELGRLGPLGRKNKGAGEQMAVPSVLNPGSSWDVEVDSSQAGLRGILLPTCCTWKLEPGTSVTKDGVQDIPQPIRPHLEMLRCYSWLCTQELLLVGSGDHMECWKSNPGQPLARSKDLEPEPCMQAT